MDEQTLKTVTGVCAMWGAAVSTFLALIKIWETFWKDRIRLETSYSFSGQYGAVDEISIVNLSGIPVQVQDWSLVWKPNRFRWRTSEIDVTPESTGRFTIPAKNDYTLLFEEFNKFDWSPRAARNRKLYLILYVFGRKRPKILKVGGGQ